MAIEEHTEGEEELLPVIQWLTDEFGLEVDARTIQRVAREEWALFDRAKVRLYVRTISWRLARLRLREHLDGMRKLDDGEPARDPVNARFVRMRLPDPALAETSEDGDMVLG
jgi:hypothetical protein